MRSLLILRHARAVRDDVYVGDHDRPLDGRGEHEAWLVGRLLATEKMAPDLILSSNAVRSLATAEIVARSAGIDAPIRPCPDLYLAPAATYVERLRGLREDCRRVMVVGHNPGLEELARLLAGRVTGFSPATLASLRLEIEGWSALNQSGRLVRVWRPEELSGLECR